MRKLLFATPTVLYLLGSNFAISISAENSNPEESLLMELSLSQETFRVESIGSTKKVLEYENGTKVTIEKAENGNVYIDGTPVITLLEDVQFEVTTNIFARAITWINNGYRRYSTNFSNRTKESAVVALSLIPGWGLYATAAAGIAYIWNRPSRTLYFHEAGQIRSDGYSRRYKTYTYLNSNFKGLFQESSWSGEYRIHW